MRNNIKYKTKLCKHFAIGNCKYNQNCSFAHDNSEKRYINKQKHIIYIPK